MDHIYDIFLLYDPIYSYIAAGKISRKKYEFGGVDFDQYFDLNLDFV